MSYKALMENIDSNVHSDFYEFLYKKQQEILLFLSVNMYK